MGQHHRRTGAHLLEVEGDAQPVGVVLEVAHHVIVVDDLHRAQREIETAAIDVSTQPGLIVNVVDSGHDERGRRGCSGRVLDDAELLVGRRREPPLPQDGRGIGEQSLLEAVIGPGLGNDLSPCTAPTLFVRHVDLHHSGSRCAPIDGTSSTSQRPTSAPTVAGSEPGLDLACAPSVFVGRRRALEAARTCLDRAAGGDAQVVWIEGAIGTGKSAFVRRLVAATEPGGTVLWAQADELATEPSFALLAQLVAVDAATPFAAGMRLVEHLGTLPAQGAVVVVVEDVQWADPASMAALLAAAQRLHHDHVALVLTSRPGARLDGWDRFLLDTERCTRIVLDGLDDDEVGELARHHGVELDAVQAQRLRGHTGGHPLYVDRCSRELTPEQLRSPAGDLPAPRSLAAVILATLAALPPDAQELAAALAVLGTPTALAAAGRSRASTTRPTRSSPCWRAGWPAGRPATPARRSSSATRCCATPSTTTCRPVAAATSTSPPPA